MARRDRCLLYAARYPLRQCRNRHPLGRTDPVRTAPTRSSALSRVPRQNKTNKRWLAAITIILFGPYAFRLWHLGRQSLWHDEAWSLMSSYQPLTPVDPNYPPLYTLLLGIWMRLVGDSVWAMRYFSLLFGTATVAAVALLTRRWFGNRAAVFSAILVAALAPPWGGLQGKRSFCAKA